MIDTDSGFIKLHRKITKWEWYTDLNVKCLFLHCLLLANHKPKQWRGLTIDRGEFITSLSHLAKDCGLTVQQVRTALNKLKSTQEVTHKATNSFTHIRVSNYNTYHDYEKKTNKVSNTVGNKRITNEQQTDNKRITTTKNDQEVEEVEEVKTNVGNTALFESLWEAYPKKDGKKAAERHFNASVKTDQDKEDIKKALANYKREVVGVENRFIKNGSTFFNNWKDKIECNNGTMNEPERNKNGLKKVPHRPKFSS
ncbi:MAG: hypothetical protein GY928_25875 [Colwellia sp.]|nr:hypothetical protein [Colwellia sp.]